MALVSFLVPFTKYRSDIFKGTPNKQLFDKQQAVAAAVMNDLIEDGTFKEKYFIYGDVIGRLNVEVVEEDIAVSTDGKLVGRGGIISRLGRHESDAVLAMTSVLSVALSADEQGREVLKELWWGLMGGGGTE